MSCPSSCRRCSLAWPHSMHPWEFFTFGGDWCLVCRWIHISYTVQGLYFLPLRAYQYKKRSWHYFLFDLCYYVTILNFIYMWFFPSNTALFMACYSLSHGSLASAVITWRNSLVFHDTDKVTSLFVHIYAPFTFTVIRSVIVGLLHTIINHYVQALLSECRRQIPRAEGTPVPQSSPCSPYERCYM